VPGARIPLSTYRLQLNGQFRFRDARAIVDYLHALGITDCYASSYLAAVPGSPHGYDVADPTRLNPDLGTDADYWGWIDALRSFGMGHILDVVPNHMGIAKSANPWWLDVLENGPSSRYAAFFDIEWHPIKAELADKVLIPILGDQYGAALERQEIQIAYSRGAFIARYYEELLPIAPDTYRLIVQPELDAWCNAHRGDDADELLSILTAADHLPSRAERDPEHAAVRAREKEVVKRRLAALTERSADVRALIDASVRALNGRAGHPHTFDRLDALLNAQSYRLAHWRVASEEINYRRFFDVNELAALRMEDPAVFEEVHRFLFELIERRAPTGLRIDHVDGLFAPGDYLRRLQERSSASSASSAATGRDFYIVVEKILGAGEQLPADWPVHGTTGYEFAAVVNNLFVDARNEAAFDQVYHRFHGERREQVTFMDLAYRSKKQVLHETMSGDINSLGHQLNRFSERNRHFRDFTLYNLISTIKEIIACFPVYRTYVTRDEPVSDHDRRYIGDAVRCARQRSHRMSAVVFDFIERLLLKESRMATADECEDRARFIGKFQQITSPVAAKGIEDTALYVYNRLLSLNEVGGDPTRFGLAPAAVHDWMIERRQRWPAALSATSTHDSKRGEDVRARLNVLSEMPGAWRSAVSGWRSVNRRHRIEIDGVTVPDPNDEWFLYQTLVGAWPFDMADPVARRRFRDRIQQYMTKALREAGVRTSWLSPNERYESAMAAFIDVVLDPDRSDRFFGRFEPFQSRVAELGIYNSLAQLVIKATAPGVPDFYQGTEFWDLNLVDPDNRRPVDYDARRRALGQRDADVDSLLESRRDGRIKMFVTARALEARAAMRAVFEEGDYVPIAAAGAKRDQLFAFARVGGAGAVVTCVPRLIASLVPDASGPPLHRAVWGDTRIELPAEVAGRAGLRYRDVFTGAVVDAQRTDEGVLIPAAVIFDRFPVAILAADTADSRWNT